MQIVDEFHSDDDVLEWMLRRRQSRENDSNAFERSKCGMGIRVDGALAPGPARFGAERTTRPGASLSN